MTVVLEGEAVIAGGTSPGLVAEAERLSARAADWARPSGEEPIDEVVLDPLLVRHVGRASGVIDAHMLGLPGDLASYRPQYDDAARLSAVQGAARWRRPPGFRVTHWPTSQKAARACRLQAGQLANVEQGVRCAVARPVLCPRRLRPPGAPGRGVVLLLPRSPEPPGPGQETAQACPPKPADTRQPENKGEKR